MQPGIINIKRELRGDYPVWLTEIKEHLAVTDETHDSELNDLMKSCIEVVERFCLISILPKTITLTADFCEEWELPEGPVTGILSVKTRGPVEGSGPPTYTTQESGWSTEGDEFLSFIPSVGGFNPSIPFRGYFDDDIRGYAVRYQIVYTVGYSVIPEDLKLAVFNEIAYRFENKGDVGGLCEASRVLAQPYKRRIWT